MDFLPGLVTSLLGREVTVIQGRSETKLFAVVRTKLDSFGLDEAGKEIWIDGLSISFSASDLRFSLSTRDRIRIENDLYEIMIPHRSNNGM